MRALFLLFTCRTLLQVGEKVDAKDPRMGAWFEAQVVKLTMSDQQLEYHIKYDE